MRIFYRLQLRALGLATIALVVLNGALGFVLSGAILDGYNAVSILPWIQVTILGGFFTAGSTILNLQIHQADEESISKTTPRSLLTLRFIDTCAVYVGTVFLPVTINYLVAMVASSIASNRGLWDFGFFPSALLFGAVLTLLGEAIAGLIRLRLLSTLVSFTLGTLAGAYTAVVPGELNNWDAFDPQNYIATLPWLSLLILLKVIIDLGATQRPNLGRAIAAGFTGILCGAAFFALSPVPLYQDRVASPGNYSCVPIDEHSACLWNESQYKVPSMRSQLERGKGLLTEINAIPTSFTVAEPGLQSAARTHFGDNPEAVTLPYTGGEEDSWISAQMIAGEILEKVGVLDQSCSEKKFSWALLDITTNYIYGDVTFTEYSSNDPEFDKLAQNATKSWDSLPESEVQTRITNMINDYLRTCEVKDLQ